MCSYVPGPGSYSKYHAHSLKDRTGEPQGVLGSSLLVLESRRVCWVLTPGPGEPQGMLGSSLLVLESRRVCWVLTPGPGEPQGVLGSSLLESHRVLGSSLLVLESRRVCWVLTPGPGEPQGVLGPHAWSWRAAGYAGVLTPGEPQGVLGSSLLESRRVCWGPHSWSWTASGRAGFRYHSALNCSIKAVNFTVNSSGFLSLN